MITHIWSVICSQTIVDRETNNATLSNVLERIEITTAKPENEMRDAGPQQLPIQFDVVTLWLSEDPNNESPTTARLVLAEPELDEELLGDPFVLDFEGRERLRTRVQVQGLKVFVSGLYWINIETTVDSENWTTVARLPLRIEFVYPA